MNTNTESQNLGLYGRWTPEERSARKSFNIEYRNDSSRNVEWMLVSPDSQTLESNVHPDERLHAKNIQYHQLRKSYGIPRFLERLLMMIHAWKMLSPYRCKPPVCDEFIQGRFSTCGTYCVFGHFRYNLAHVSHSSRVFR